VDENKLPFLKKVEESADIDDFDQVGLLSDITDSDSAPPEMAHASKLKILAAGEVSLNIERNM
jgi:hypothetical protein